MNTNTTFRIGTVVVAIGLTLAGCRTSDGPSEDKLAKAFASRHSPLGMPVPDKQAACLADAYSDSGLSAEYLRALAAGRRPAKVSKDDQDELADLAAKVAADCLA